MISMSCEEQAVRKGAVGAFAAPSCAQAWARTFTQWTGGLFGSPKFHDPPVYKILMAPVLRAAVEGKVALSRAWAYLPSNLG